MSLPSLVAIGGISLTGYNTGIVDALRGETNSIYSLGSASANVGYAVQRILGLRTAIDDGHELFSASTGNTGDTLPELQIAAREARDALLEVQSELAYRKLAVDNVAITGSEELTRLQRGGNGFNFAPSETALVDNVVERGRVPSYFEEIDGSMVIPSPPPKVGAVLSAATISDSTRGLTAEALFQSVKCRDGNCTCYTFASVTSTEVYQKASKEAALDGPIDIQGPSGLWIDNPGTSGTIFLTFRSVDRVVDLLAGGLTFPAFYVGSVNDVYVTNGAAIYTGGTQCTTSPGAATVRGYIASRTVPALKTCGVLAGAIMRRNVLVLRYQGWDKSTLVVQCPSTFANGRLVSASISR